MRATVGAKTITLDLPEELLDLLGPSESLSDRVRESLVLSLLRDASISQGKAAQLLGITRWTMMQLMVRHCIPSGPETAEEMRQELETAMRYVRSASVDGGGQQQ